MQPMWPFSNLCTRYCECFMNTFIFCKQKEELGRGGAPWKTSTIIAAGESKAMSSREKFKVSNENLDIIFPPLATSPSSIVGAHSLRRLQSRAQPSMYRPGATAAHRHFHLTGTFGRKMTNFQLALASWSLSFFGFCS